MAALRDIGLDNDGSCRWRAESCSTSACHRNCWTLDLGSHASRNCFRNLSNTDITRQTLLVMSKGDERMGWLLAKPVATNDSRADTECSVCLVKFAAALATCRFLWPRRQQRTTQSPHGALRARAKSPQVMPIAPPNTC